MVTEIKRHNPLRQSRKEWVSWGKFLARVEEVWVFEPINFPL